MKKIGHFKFLTASGQGVNRGVNLWSANSQQNVWFGNTGKLRSPPIDM